MSLTSYRAAPPRAIFAFGAKGLLARAAGGAFHEAEGAGGRGAKDEEGMGWGRSRFGGPGGDLLSQVLRHSTIGAEAFDGRVRDGIGSCHFAESHQAGETVIGGSPRPART